MAGLNQVVVVGCHINAVTNYVVAFIENKLTALENFHGTDRNVCMYGGGIVSIYRRLGVGGCSYIYISNNNARLLVTR